MNIGGFLKNSFVDYPGKISSVIFSNGCNYKCWYCHNKELLNSNKNIYKFEEIKDFLATRVGKIDAVVFSGGEPTLQNDLIEKIREIKNLGFLIKLDTNGTNPYILEKLIKEKLLDYVAMDIKTTFEKYDFITGVDSNIKNVKQSISILLNSEIAHEFRTTFSPDISIEDINIVYTYIENCSNFYLQKYRPCNEGDNNVHKMEDFYKCIENATPHKFKVKLRNI